MREVEKYLKHIKLCLCYVILGSVPRKWLSLILMRRRYVNVLFFKEIMSIFDFIVQTLRENTVAGNVEHKHMVLQ